MSTPRKEVLADGIELWLGDCREVLPTLGPIHALISDPPYGNSNHDGDWNARLNEHRGIESKPILNDGAVEMRDVVDAVLTQAVRLLPKEASACCLFCGGGGGRVRFLRGLRSAWTGWDWSSFTPSSGTSATLVLGNAIAGNMKC